MTDQQALAQALTALADPTRRQIFERVAAGPRAVGDLADELPVSRPAVSQHLKVLAEAGLVSARAEGTRRFYELDPRGLAGLRDYLDGFWSRSLTAYRRAADAEARTRKKEQR
jgi:DNA-binding transcriptional ArsR family regulator